MEWMKLGGNADRCRALSTGRSSELRLRTTCCSIVRTDCLRRFLRLRPPSSVSSEVQVETFCDTRNTAASLAVVDGIRAHQILSDPELIVRAHSRKVQGKAEGGTGRAG